MSGTKPEFRERTETGSGVRGARAGRGNDGRPEMSERGSLEGGEINKGLGSYV